MKKIDHKKELKQFYNATAKRVEFVDVPGMNFLMMDGTGNPNTSGFYKDCVAALFAISYTLKFMVKKSELQVDYSVMPLEGLWWMDDMSRFTLENKDEWKWTMMIMQPGFITGKMVDVAIKELIKKKKFDTEPPVRFENYSEGFSAQVLHVGPFTEEGPAVMKVHEHIIACGNKIAGRHHEIYLSDIRKAAPEKWKTIIRQPAGKI
jgi:hypothetical protein